MTGSTIVATMQAAAVAVATIRLWSWSRRAPIQRWRLASLIALQPIAAVLLYATLFPPVRDHRGGTLVVATAGATGPGSEDIVALPEATIRGATRAPDVATALRRHPGIRTIRVVGSGLEPRDRDAARSVSLRFDPPSPPTGIVALQPPAPVAPGAQFRVAVRVVGRPGATVELIDPAERVVDARPVATTDMVLAATVRTPGVALFTVRVREASGRVTDRAAVPVWTDAPAPTRLLVIADAPGPEVKYLRRWAVDAGLSPTTRLGIGGGATLADAVPAGIAQADAIVLDDRSWSAMGAGQRQSIAAAVRNGLGLLVRITGPLPRGWRVLGLSATAGPTIAPTRLLPAAPSDAMLAARRGPGTRDAPASASGARDDVPVLTRQVAGFGADAIPILRDARGIVLAAWRPVGRGRVGVIALQDSFALVTSGHGDRHGELWSALVSTVARARTASIAAIDPLPRTGQRVAICGAGAAQVVAPDGNATRLIADPTTGTPPCAGYWPRRSGWHLLTGTAARPFYVYPAGALAELRLADRREGTARLVGDRTRATAAAGNDEVRGPAWPWFVAWLVVAALLWWLERARIGRSLSSSAAATEQAGGLIR